MSKKDLTCPNCTESLKNEAKLAESGCVLCALMQVVRERGNLKKTQIRKYHANVAIDELWEDIGPIVDRLEGGGYSDC